MYIAMATTTESILDYEDYTDYPEYKAGLMIWKVVPPILITFGTIGNVLSILVLTRKSIKVSTTALYLTFLAFSDLCVLYTGLLRQWVIYLFEYDVRHISPAGCKVHIWLVYTSLDFSAWILIAVTLERVISAWCPYSAKTKCSRKYATALVVAILIFLLGLNSHLLYGMGDKVVVDESTNATVIMKCNEVDKAYGDFFNLIWPWVDLCAFCLIPFTVIVVGNGCILFKVIKSQRKTNARIVPSINTGETRTSHRNSPKHSSMTAMLFTLNMVFLFTTSPVSIYNIGYTHWLSDGSHQTYATLDLWWAIVNMLMYTNNSLNFLLYCLSGTRFRQEVYRMFCSRFRQRAESPQDLYTRTKFNTQIPSPTPSHMPNKDKKLPNTFQVTDQNRLHSTDTNGFGLLNSLHPESALNRSSSTTCISFVNGGPTCLTNKSEENSPPLSTKKSLNLNVPVSDFELKTTATKLNETLSESGSSLSSERKDTLTGICEHSKTDNADETTKTNDQKLPNAEVLHISVISANGIDKTDTINEQSV